MHDSHRGRTLRRPGALGALALALLLVAPGLARAQNPIQVENAQPGTPQATWDIPGGGAGDPSIQGFATDISVNRGETVHFKIDTNAATFHIDIYRLGYYNGDGARLQATINGVVGQVQQAPLHDDATGLNDCGNWTESAQWNVPADAVSGIYIARLERDDTHGVNHIVFIVRDDASHSDLQFQTSDGTWQAYNGYGGNSLYTGAGLPNNHAAKVSYNRPFTTRGGGGGSSSSEDWLFNAEYPMVRWLESNGYDVSYSTDVDCDRHGALIMNNKVWLAVGHDEYWSAGARAAVTAARDAGVHLAFFSGNEVYWKTRYEPSIDPSATPYRTLVCYKEGTMGELACGGKCDPLANVWTGLWRDGCPPTPPNDGCAPENALTGQISWNGSTGAIQVPDTYKDVRLWRNTEVATLGSGQTATLGTGTLGYEWDPVQFLESAPPGRITLSNTSFNNQTHQLSLYRHGNALVFGAGTVQWSWGLDAMHDGGNAPASPTVQQATLNLLAEMGAQPTTLQPGLVPATASGDHSPPASTIGSPADGATVQTNTAVSVSGTSADAGGGTVRGVEVSVDGGTTWAPAMGTTSWTFAWTPLVTGDAVIKVRAVDDWANLETPGAGITVHVGAGPPPTCPCTAWDASVVPGNPAFPDVQAVEVGVRFRVDADGFIGGVRFYKGVGNGGIHVGKIYTNTGTPLANATFADETPTGWQQVNFSNPVAVTSGTTYVATVWLPQGHYAYDGAYFSGHGVDHSPVHLLADGVDGGNGCFHYGSEGFPNQFNAGANYWVDVVFNSTSGPDVTPPVIVALQPGNGATAVAATATVRATFNEAMNAATITSATFELHDGGNALVPANVTYNSASQTATLAPSSPLAYTTTYTARVTTGAQDAAGNGLAADQVWSFTTGGPPPPPPNEGPGGPILVISQAVDPFSRYPVEILRAEGLNEFAAMDLSLVTPAVLNAHDVVVLGHAVLSAADVTMLNDWVNAGGTLIALRPDAQLAPLLGITPAAGTLDNKYLLVNTASGPGVGIVNQTIQYHGSADLYTLSGATAVATLYSNATTATSNPAVTTRNVGANGGRAIAFTYDLARSIVYTRQGNPAWSGQKRDGQQDPIRSDDQFFGNASFDPQPDWVDLSKVAIPQADEQQRLLANAITLGNLHRMPLPRFWYLPKGLKAAIVMTGDDHGDSGMQPRFDIYRSQSTPNCSVDDWECIRATGYEFLGSAFTPAQAQLYESLGFEVAMHINTGCTPVTQEQYEATVSQSVADFEAQFPGVPPLTTNRNHCVAWNSWSQVPEVESAHGIRLDTNYYFWPPSWVNDTPGLFTGSGIPMRFAKLDGTIIDCYQACTQMPDESGESFPAFCDALLDRALGPQGYYGVFTTNMHFDFTPNAGSDAVVASAQAHGVPVVSARQMLNWLDGKNGSTFADLAWSGNQLSFTLGVGTGARNLRGMLPWAAAAGELASLTRDGQPVALTRETIKGVDYGFFPASAGAFVATYVADTTPPAISAVSATPGAGGTTAVVTWTTDDPSDSRVDYGTSPGSLAQSASGAIPVTSHSLGLTGLSPATTYYYRVTSADAASNAATSPAPPAAPATFMTPGTACALDQTAAEFAQGSTIASVAITEVGDGELTLAPLVSADFSGSALPAGWGSAPWTGGGSATVAGGKLTVSGAGAFGTSAFGPGRSIEFVATFTGSPYQNVGFATDATLASPWVTIGVGSSANGVYARNSLNQENLLGAGLLGSSHRYRIDWNANDFTFFVDGVQAYVMPFSVGTPMLQMVSDFTLDANALDVDWLRVTPYASSGSFTSRVFDSGGGTTWQDATWIASLPAGTSLAMFQRQGSTPTPDGSWSAFTAIPSSGAAVGGSGRYLQYRADLATTAPGSTPSVDEVRFHCTSSGDVTPPVISAVLATPGPTGTTAHVTWTTDEPATSSVSYGTSPALGSTTSGGSLVVSHALDLTSLNPSATYYFRVGSIDGAGNPATFPDPPAAPASFTTPAPAPTTCAHDQVAADFSAGTLANAIVTTSADGEVTLAPGLDVDFSGNALPAGWASFTWPYGAGNGTSTVSGGQLIVDGARANPEPFAAGPGSSLEFVATFTGDQSQHVGFGAGNNVPPNEVYNTLPFAIFSTGGGGPVQARTWTGSGTSDYAIPLNLLNAPHRYRIDWGASSVSYYVDGALVHTDAFAISGPMRPAASDIFAGGGAVTVDWMRMTPPYASSGTFTSRVFDAGSAVAWAAMSWTATTPAGTSLAFLVRKGDTPVPDGTWTAYTAVPSSGSSVGGSSRYIQYSVALATTDPTATPMLEDVSVTCSACSGAPTAIADLAVTRASTGGAEGRRPIVVSFTMPTGATSVKVYRAPFGGYPRYDDAGGSTPATPSYPPGAPWVLTGVTASGQQDDPGARDQWHYVAFWQSGCGTTSVASNRPAGVLDYILGDVSDGVTVCTGDNAVGTVDLTVLGAHYGATLTGSEPYACADVGPTTDLTTSGRPTTDGVLEFEDLLMFALDYGSGGGPAIVATAPSAAKQAAAARDELALDAPALVRAGETFTVTLRMSGAGSLRGVSVPLAWDAAVASPRGVESGGFLEAQSGVVFSPKAGKVDAALLGQRSDGITGQGVLATFTFVAIRDGSPALAVGPVIARDLANRTVTLGGVTAAPPPLPTVTAFDHVAPNPFADRASIAFALAREGAVDLSIYSIDGRLVRNLARGTLPAGRHALEWDRRDGRGDRVGSGLYIVRLTTNDGRFTRKVSVVQ